jgi:hypothetical protein
VSGDCVGADSLKQEAADHEELTKTTRCGHAALSDLASLLIADKDDGAFELR